MLHAIEIRDLSFSYSGVKIFEGLELTVPAGQHVGLIGPNGVGKTTLFHTICGVLKAAGGTITLFDNPVKAGRFNPDIGLVFQYPDDQLFSPTVRDDVGFGPLNMGLSSEQVNIQTEAALNETGMLPFAERAPHHLSGGQKRMVAIAGVRAMRPRIVLYDEPSANLDIRSRRQLINFIKESEETVLVSSHDLELILEVSERVILMDEGGIIADGDPARIMSDDTLMKQHGLERPHSLKPHLHIPEVK